MQRLTIPGPAGALEALLELPAAFSGGSAAVLCHPHPLYGGTMRNKVVARMAQALLDCGLAALRFNFRGVEASEGSHDSGNGEVADACAAVAYLAQTLAPRQLLLGGFSFGAWVAARSLEPCGAEAELLGLLSVGTPAGMYDYSFLACLRRPILFVHGDADTVCAPAAVGPLAHAEGRPRSLILVKGADHFFTGRLKILQEVIRGHYQPLVRRLEHSGGM
jgi:alpha/beta superfamily hydrolase